MRLWNLMLVLIMVTGVLVGCGGEASAPEGDIASADADPSVDINPNPDSALDVSYEGALPVSSQLALGIFELEDTENAVTAEQAETLLPLWQALQVGSLQSQAETSAVFMQIEGAMTAEQLAAVAAIQLTFEDLRAWMQDQGVDFGPPQGAAVRQVPFGNVSGEERAAMRATAQAGGVMPGEGGPFGNRSEEERAAMRATAEASGMTFGNRPAGAGRGQLSLLAEQVVELLTSRAAD